MVLRCISILFVTVRMDVINVYISGLVRISPTQKCRRWSALWARSSTNAFWTYSYYDDSVPLCVFGRVICVVSFWALDVSCPFFSTIDYKSQWNLTDRVLEKFLQRLTRACILKRGRFCAPLSRRGRRHWPHHQMVSTVRWCIGYARDKIEETWFTMFAGLPRSRPQ